MNRANIKTLKVCLKSRNRALRKKALETLVMLSDYVDVDYKAMKAIFLRIPKLDEIPYPVQMEPYLVVEFYSR